MSNPLPFTWRDAPPALRLLARWVTITQAAGYGISLVLLPRMPRTPDMLLTTHAHLLGMTAVFALSGVCFALCERPTGRWKAAIMVTPFLAILAGLMAVWLASVLDHRFVWVMPVTGTVMSLAFYVQVVVVLRELRKAAD
jgi:hypothetical protein